MAERVKSGREFWLEEGIEKGIEKGRLKGCIKALLSLNLPFDTMISSIMETCKLTKAEAQQALKSLQVQQ